MGQPVGWGPKEGTQDWESADTVMEKNALAMSMVAKFYCLGLQLTLKFQHGST